MTAELPPGDQVAFGRFRLTALIGQGGMGKVYRAHDTVIGRDVAIKVLPVELSDQPGYRERFRREAHTAARLTEPHIIPIHDAGDNDDGRLYLVMPVIDGIDVHSLLKRDGPMAPERAVAVVEQLAAALDAAHEAGLVHRDVKPSNALLTRHDFVYLIDFGIAHDATATKLTNTGMMVGTLAYMAPERFTTGTADARADIYALACVLHECLTGVQPYPGESIEQQIAGHLTLDPPKPATLNPAVPAGFDHVIATGMAKKPDQRYQSARDLAAAARHALTEMPVPTLDPDGATALIARPAAPPMRHVSVDSPDPHLAATEHRAHGSPWLPSTVLDSPPPPVATVQSLVTTKGPSARRKTILLIAVVLVIFGVGVNRIGIPFWEHYVYPRFFGHRASQLSDGVAEQTVLPFNGLNKPVSVAVDAAGSVYVVDFANNRVLGLAAGSSASTVLPTKGLNPSFGVAVDAAANLYGAEFINNRVLKLAADPPTQTVLSFTGFSQPEGLAVDAAGNVYVADDGNNRVLKLAADAPTQTVLSFTGLSQPEGLAVDAAGNVHVADNGNNRVVKLAAG